MKPYYEHAGITIFHGDCQEVLPTLGAGSVHCVVTSPPYWGLRDYGVSGQLGLEPIPAAYVSRMVEVFQAVRRVLRDDGTLWLNLGDSYASQGGCGEQGQAGQMADRQACQPGGPRERRSSHSPPFGLKSKDLIGIPWRVALALQADGWYLRSDIIWAKPNPMPESITDRPTKSHEHLFLLTKSARYHYDAEAIKEPASNTSGWAKQRQKGENTWDYGRDGYNENRIGGMSGKETFLVDENRNRRDVWTIPTQPYKGAHFATFPQKLVEPCILAGCPEGGVVMDPFSGAGTVAVVAQRLGHSSINVELNADYCEIAAKRLGQEVLPFSTGSGG